LEKFQPAVALKKVFIFKLTLIFTCYRINFLKTVEHGLTILNTAANQLASVWSKRKNSSPIIDFTKPLIAKLNIQHGC